MCVSTAGSKIKVCFVVYSVTEIIDCLKDENSSVKCVLLLHLPFELGLVVVTGLTTQVLGHSNSFTALSSSLKPCPGDC